MKIIVSPAKKLDFENPARTKKFTGAKYLEKAQVLIEALRECSSKDIAKLMKLSDKLTDLNVQRYKDYHTPFSLENAKQAMYAFKGDTYVGLNAEEFTSSEIGVAQRKLRILSGLYGILRPLDLMQPYRLEMGTRFGVQGNKDLYGVWKETLTSDLNKEIKKDKDSCLVNLASKEYSGAIDLKSLDVPVVTCHFKEKKGDEYKMVGLFAKRARGMMANYIIKNNLSDPKELQKFDYDDYKFNKSLSSDLDLVFTR